MTGRDLFRFIKKINFIFVPISWIGKIYVLYLRPFSSNCAVIWRYFIYRNCFKSIGTNVSIHKNVIIRFPQNISLGNNISIHPLCYVDAQGGLEIGDNVSIAHNCSIVTFNHTWKDKNYSIKYNSLHLDKVKIEEDVWIGAGVRIMAGVHISTRCIIAAGSVVTKDCEPNSIYAGVPARLIKKID